MNPWVEKLYESLAGPRCSVGIDIGTSTVVGAAVSKTASGVRLRGLAHLRRDRSPHATIAEQVHHVLSSLERQGPKPAEVTASAPPEALMSMALELPPRASGAPVERIAHAELARAHSAEEASFSSVLRETGVGKAGQTLAIGLGLPDEAGDSIFNAIEAAGCQIHTLAAQQSALERLCTRLPERCVAVLDLGGSGARTVVCVDGRMMIDRPLPIEPGAGADELCREMETTFAFLNHSRPDVEVERVAIIGGRSNPGLASSLASEMGIQSEILTVESLADIPSELGSVSRHAGATLAFGLALLGLDEGGAL